MLQDAGDAVSFSMLRRQFPHTKRSGSVWRMKYVPQHF